MDSARRVTRLWPGATVVCAASGPSLTAEDLAFVRGRARVIVVNTTYQLAPWADVLYACDQRWWHAHKDAAAFAGLKFALEPGALQYGVTVLKNGGNEGLSLEPTHLRTGKNSGYQAINLAVLLGASRILLLGYDLQRGQKGEGHWHPEHPRRTADAVLLSWARYFKTIVEPLKAHGVEVINCSRRTVLKGFPRMPIEQALPLSLEVAS